MSTYQQHTLEGASPVELVVALYDGIVRFLYSAIAAVEAGDAHARRSAVKRALDILIHLQARLRMDIGGRPAEVLSEFYASVFALILQASQASSAERFEEVIGYIRNVRDAWRQVSIETSRNSGNGNLLLPRRAGASQQSDAGQASSWTA